MKRIIIAFCVLSLSILACGATLPTPSQLVSDVNMETHTDTLPVKVVTTSEPTESAPIYFTTAPLNVRACASVDCEKLADLPINTQVTVFILDLQGPGCEGGEWYAIDAPKSGYVCSLYIEER